MNYIPFINFRIEKKVGKIPEFSCEITKKEGYFDKDTKRKLVHIIL